MTPTRRSPTSPESGFDRVANGRVTRYRATRAVVARKSITGLPDVDGAPPAWADDRAGLADAIPWFRVYQGGMSRHDNICYGFLVDGDSGIRSYIDDEVIITRVGGKSAKDEDGNLILQQDQEDTDSLVRSITNTMEAKLAVGLIIGSKNTQLGRKLPHRFNIMDFFRVAYIWNERISGKIAVRLRFEKLNLFEKSWWAEKGSLPPLPHAERIATPEILQCSACQKESPRVYEEGWMCLNKDCADKFWKLNGSEPPKHLTFNRRWLEARLPPDPEIQPPYRLVPDLSWIDVNNTANSFSRVMWRGIVCPKCKKCVSRRFWTGWKCQDPLQGQPHTGCDFEKSVKVNEISLELASGDYEFETIKRPLLFDPDLMRPQIDDTTFKPYRKLTYNLEGIGYITHFIANREINARPGGPNDLFRELQTVDLGLRRYAMGQAVVTGTLNSQFTVNYGMPYKFVVAVNSRGFNEACDPILRSLGRLTWATEQAVKCEGDTTSAPNELLLLGYFEDQKIGFHDDGEDSLGPTIASLSLGAPSKMEIRLKKRYFHSFTTNSGPEIAIPDPHDLILPGCHKYKERKELQARFLDGSICREEYEQTFVSLVRNARRGPGPVIIRMKLRHGDMMVMHGASLQKYYEHSVTVDKNQKLRFALTARHVKPDKVDQAEWPKGRFDLTPEQIYDGK